MSNARLFGRACSGVLLALTALLPPIASCTALGQVLAAPVNLLINQTTQRRGNILIGFVNNTTARAIFTFGGYDQLDQGTTPSFNQARLAAGTSSAQITQVCRRVFSIGGVDLIKLVKANGQNITDEAALRPGVTFSTAPNTDPLGGQPTEGSAASMVLQVGVNYECAGLLLFTFDPDSSSPGGFKITFRFVPQD